MSSDVRKYNLMTDAGRDLEINPRLSIHELVRLDDSLGKSFEGFREANTNKVLANFAEQATNMYYVGWSVGARDVAEHSAMVVSTLAKFRPLGSALAMYIGIGPDEQKKEITRQDVDNLIGIMRSSGMSVKVFDRPREGLSADNLANVRKRGGRYQFNILLQPDQQNLHRHLVGNIIHDLVAYMLEVGFDYRTGEISPELSPTRRRFDRELPQFAAYLVATDALLATVDKLRDSI